MFKYLATRSSIEYLMAGLRFEGQTEVQLKESSNGAGAGVRIRKNREPDDGGIGREQPGQSSIGFVRKLCPKSNGEVFKTCEKV